MKTEDDTPADELSRQFQRDLSDLVAEAFGRGVAIERTWNLTTPVADAPNWRVSIEKTYSDDDPPYEPTLLDE